MNLEVPSSFKRPNGKWEHHIRQSDLGTFAHCPELHRRALCGSVVGDEGDAALVGTACHASYAWATQTLLEGKDVSGGDLLGVAHDTLTNDWRNAEADSRLRQMQIATIDEARTLINGYLQLWSDNVLPILYTNVERIETVEYRFDIKVYEDDKRVIFLSGSWDLGFDGRTWDYKHSNSDKYTTKKAWQLSRYHPQATHYSWAYDETTLAKTTMEDNEQGYLGTLAYPDDSQLSDFTFININNKGVTFLGPKEGVRPRTVGDCRFHLELMKSLCYLIEAELPVWPLGPNDWWCSSKWCPAWKDCRGKYIGNDPWNLLAKAEAVLEKRR